MTEQEKLLKRARVELVELHKRVLLNYLICKGLEYPVYSKFFAIYNTEINEKNIQRYFHCPCAIFVRALLLNRLDDIRGMGPKVEKLPKKYHKQKTCTRF